MGKILTTILFILAIAVTGSHAQDVESFDRAKKTAASQDKPILMEFLHPG